jgi:RNA polymerase sigma factor (sigma-70 family)
MQAIDDMALLREYAASRSDGAFAELVARHVNFVHSAALRQVRDPHLAEEITQAVFAILAQKAGKISDKAILTGWLFKTTRFAALAQIRTEAKRRQREQEAQMQTELEPTAADENWAQMSPLLDEALAALGAKDRQAVLLRFFEGKNLAEVGTVLNAGEDTARKRVSRALEKLRKFFAKRGVVLTTAIIASVISANAVQAAPAGLVTTITVTAAQGSAVAASTMTLVKGTFKIMTYAKLKLALGIAAATLVAAGTVNLAISSIVEPVDKDSAGEATVQEKTYANEVIKSLTDESYQEFVADGDSNFKTIKQSIFKAVCDQRTAQLKGGYHVVFLGVMMEGKSRMTLWKISYDDGSDDDLLRLMVSDGKISGALLTPPNA